MNRKEFRFFSSILVPSSFRPTGLSETLASQRSDPSSMLQSHTPRWSRRLRSAER